MKYLLTILLLLGANSAMAKVHYLNLEMKRMPFQRDYYYPGMTNWGHELTLNMGVSTGDLFLESRLNGRSRQGRFRDIYWQYTLGYTLFGPVDLIWGHRSQHSMDFQADTTTDRYPVSDSYGIRINFLR